MDTYDPDRPPDPQRWLALDEHERIRLVLAYHDGAGVKVVNDRAHAMFHAIVENQVAQAFAPSCRAIERLQREGLSRHDAIHAIGSVLAKFIAECEREEATADDSDRLRKLNVAIEVLSAFDVVRVPKR